MIIDFFLNADCFTSDIIEQCKRNANVPQFLLNDTKNNIKEVFLKG